ncbi:uncharacterized protein stg1 [Palaemon carinicauda]|uniref:uncharacterized protein stg1 n=1 Tax=Palaemon carinicauda TaxID=392227 RepID=UPI0035B6A33A
MLSLDATVHILWLGTTIAACLSGVTVLTALSIDAWLKSEEKILNPSYRNGSSKVEFLSKKTKSGIFTLCTTEVGKSEFQCHKIDYFPTEEYSPDPNDSTMAIPHTVLKSVGFFLTAVVLLTLAEILCISGHCFSRRRFFTFLSGITFIISGLFMMLGMVIYIATLKGEVAEKLRPRSTFQPPLFVYTYGWSCYLIMLGFITTEIAGITAVFLYIYWHKRDWSKKEEQKYHSQLLETPPPCLKHPRQRSLSFHSSIEPAESLEIPLVRRSRSQQYLERQPQEQSTIQCHPNHVGHNHINHPNHKHSKHYSHQHNHQQHQLSYQKPQHDTYPSHYHKDLQRTTCDVEKHPPPYHQFPRSLQHQQHHPVQEHQSQSQRYPYHQQHSYPQASTSQQSVHWSNKSLDNLPRSGRSLHELRKSDYLDEVLLSRSGTLPRTQGRESGNILRGGGTLPRSFPRSYDTLCSSQITDREGSLSRNYAKDDIELCNSYSRRGYQYSNNGQCNVGTGNQLCNGQGGVCNIGAECCSCCACYCCCCCWQEESNRATFGNRGTQSQNLSHMQQRTNTWQHQGKYPQNSTPHISREVSCNTVCNTIDLNTSSGSLPQPHQYPQQQRHHPQQSASQEMTNLNYSPRVSGQRQGYSQADAQRHTTPV